ncbi:hypothetical protein EDD11_009094 [Mortierella claussenii]|nr:hypothetical protein EDD11_009094 [Mortierella claussenii]
MNSSAATSEPPTGPLEPQEQQCTFNNTYPAVSVPRGTFVYASAPARIDLAGGWTDTIPITLILTLSFDPSIPSEHYRSLEQIRDHADPTVPCALLKACIVASGVLGITPQRHDDVPYKTVAEALKHSGGGLELVVRSSLPIGSGMGTSSILAAAILAVLKTLKGEAYTTEDLLYMTLDVEQMMNTGGGWQDQVGGVLPGFKVSTCGLGQPIRLNAMTMDLPEEFTSAFNSRLLLIYTGQTRLAKNLLQTVLMNWAGRDEAVVNTMHQLVQDATLCQKAILEDDMTTIGAIMSRYFTAKRFLSDTTLDHPPVVGRLLQHLEPFIEGATLAGAGGGGFLAALIKPGLDRDRVHADVKAAIAAECLTLDDEEAAELMWEWNATVDTAGLVVQVGEAIPID